MPGRGGRTPLEADGRHRAIEPQQGADAFEGQGCDHGLVLAAISRRGRVGTLAHWCPGVGRGVPQVAAGLVQEDQILGIDRGDRLTPGRAGRLVAFLRPQRLFFRL